MLDTELNSYIFGGNASIKHVEYGSMCIAWGEGFIGIPDFRFRANVLIRTFDNPDMFSGCPGIFVNDKDGIRVSDCINFVEGHKSGYDLDNYIVLVIPEIGNGLHEIILINSADITHDRYACICRFAERFGVTFISSTDAIAMCGLFKVWSRVYVPMTKGAYGDIPCLLVMDEDSTNGIVIPVDVDASQYASYEDVFQDITNLARSLRPDDTYVCFRISHRDKSIRVLLNKSFCAYTGRMSNAYYIRPVVAALHYDDDINDYQRNELRRYLIEHGSLSPIIPLTDGHQVVIEEVIGRNYNVDQNNDKPPEDPMKFLVWAASKGG